LTYWSSYLRSMCASSHCTEMAAEVLMPVASFGVAVASFGVAVASFGVAVASFGVVVCCNSADEGLRKHSECPGI